MIDRDTLIRKAKEAADAHDAEHLRFTDFTLWTGIRKWHVYKHFRGWRDLCRQAGLATDDRLRRLEDSELFMPLKEFILEHQHAPRFMEFSRYSPHSIYSYKRRWGTWPNVLAAFRSWIETEDPDFPFLSELPEKATQPRPPKPTYFERRKPDNKRPPRWPAAGQRQFGEVLNFRGLQHAPINEQGVIFLFGIVAHDLGYLVESINIGFPDCEAKRLVRRSDTRWERVRVEFEFQSRNFRDHGHAPDGCEVIICWEHNWPDCPVEVLELRSAITHLSG